MARKNGKGRMPVKSGKSVKKYEASSRGNGADDEGNAPKTHNMAARREIIVKTIKRVKRLEEERDAIGADIRALIQTEIKGNLGMWSPQAVRHRLQELHAAGRVERISKPHTNGLDSVHLYRRARTTKETELS